VNPVARRFSRAASTYDQGAVLHRHVAARLLELLPEADQVGRGRILEVGCGTGVLTGLIRQRYPDASLCVMDVAEGMVACVRERWGDDPAMEYVVSDVRNFKTERPFDLIVSSSALHWATPLDTTMTTLRAAMKPGGGLSVALMIDGTLGELHLLRRKIAPAKTPAAGLPGRGGVLSAVEAAGLAVVIQKEETLRARYHSADDFLGTIHAQGLTAGEVSRAALPLSRGELNRIRAKYDETCRDAAGGVYATFEVLYLALKRAPLSS
jgi:malonyl-CoA O-methyltransferase